MEMFIFFHRLGRIHQLINAGVDVNAPDSPESGNRALHWAVCFGKPQAVQCLLGMLCKKF